MHPVSPAGPSCKHLDPPQRKVPRECQASAAVPELPAEDRKRAQSSPIALAARFVLGGHQDGVAAVSVGVESLSPERFEAMRDGQERESGARSGRAAWAPRRTLNLRPLRDACRKRAQARQARVNLVQHARHARVLHRGRELRPHPSIEPVEIGRVLKAFTDEQARAIFLTVVLTGLRRFELKGLRWRDVALVEGVLRVRVSKSEEGERLIALSPALVTALEQHYKRTAFKGDDELVFCHPKRGSMIDDVWWAARFREALKAAGIEGHVRPWHDLRHTAITNDAAAGSSELAVMAKAGHRSMSTTKTYLHLAGVVFRNEADALEQRLLGSATNPQTKISGLA